MAEWSKATGLSPVSLLGAQVRTLLDALSLTSWQLGVRPRRVHGNMRFDSSMEEYSPYGVLCPRQDLKLSNKAGMV